MILVDESTVKVGGVVLPGLFKSIEVKADAQVEEQQVEGKTQKPKQAIGYEDAKITLELVLEDGPQQTKLEKLAVIQNLFKKPGQQKPVVHDFVHAHTAVRGISKVIFKNLTTKEQNKKSELAVTIEFWEYIPMKITATKSAAAGRKASGSDIKLNADYKQYLTSRGAAPKMSDKTTATPARDDAKTAYYKAKMAQLEAM
ncbi:hypothetical protein POTG_01738 [Paenibacillus sp. oral taxon 786 str. D14]|uniref:hypothetical protein n=1 Tax=Paenibacillus sp. oral taxon 786 TaxID=652715 RepID=UPI0001AFD27D|nr:hypothetical protein [Paenibacillus sp. oral taxon 786]EES73443.1 hypothetical protein POTG_01738 [Paenibacillus sp. oral taxon 786 str. D14]